MTYGTSSDGMDDYLKMGKSTAHECLQNFTAGIIELYGKRYLRRPTYDDIIRLYAEHDSRHMILDMVSQHVGKRRLYALGLVQMPCCMAQTVH